MCLRCGICVLIRIVPSRGRVNVRFGFSRGRRKRKNKNNYKEKKTRNEKQTAVVGRHTWSQTVSKTIEVCHTPVTIPVGGCLRGEAYCASYRPTPVIYYPYFYTIIMYVCVCTSVLQHAASVVNARRSFIIIFLRHEI